VHIRQERGVPGVATEKRLSESFHDHSKVIRGDWFLNVLRWVFGRRALLPMESCCLGMTSEENAFGSMTPPFDRKVIGDHRFL